MTPRKRTPIGPDVDLEVEDIRLPDGGRLTEVKVAEIAERVHGRHPGRPSVSGDRERTPAMTVRVTPAARASLEEIASAQGRRLADVSRDALDEYIHRHVS
ncbi:MAG: ribbon-helix-helix protein, CopG family [Candidatus Dormibacteria bacterium]